MTQSERNWKIRLVSSIREIGETSWRSLESADYPFNDFEFFDALETSGSIGKGTGWQTNYLISEGDDGEIFGVLYAFVKQHSYGEYIFDWQWAHFYEANGTSFYPKFLTAVPFTPATGPRILVKDCPDKENIRRALIASAVEIAERSGLSSYHALFVDRSELEHFEEQGFMVRHSLQYHWRNAGYQSFEEFLGVLIGKRRRDIIRERSRARSHGLKIECLTGAELTARHAEAMDAFYRSTIDKKNSMAYLTTDFFLKIFTSMRDRILFVLASKDGQPIAAALNFYKGRKLFGRYWGAAETYADLHFELCYYQTIEFAIKQGIDIFEAGAQGEHKVQRGFSPSLTYSAHRIFDPRFSLPIEQFVIKERLAIAEHMMEFSTPFREKSV